MDTFDEEAFLEPRPYPPYRCGRCGATSTGEYCWFSDVGKVCRACWLKELGPPAADEYLKARAIFDTAVVTGKVSC